MPSSGHFKNSSAAVTMESSDGGDSMENYNMDTKNGNNDSHQNTKPITSFDPIEYVQRTRITKPVFAKPAADPLQFIKVKPCNLYQSAQEQLKKAEEVKKVKEIKKEEPEDWQSNLDNWKSSRRKRVEHIIDRVVEVKKFEMEDFDRTRRKSKTFSEMLEERGTRGNKVTLPVYTEDDANDLTDLGIGTSSTSCKSSVSEDFDNHSVVSDSQESTHNSSNNNDHHNNDNNSDYDNPSPINNISSSQNSCEYTYEGAIQGYKTRISTKFQSSNFSNKIQTATSDNNTEKFYNFSNRFAGGGDKFIKSQEKLFSNNNCEIENNNNNNNDINTNLPKIDISKKKELFENRTQSSLGGGATTEIIKISPKVSQEFSQSKSIKERLSNFGRRDSEEMPPKESTKVEVEQVVSLKDRLSNFEKQIINEKPTVASNVPSKIDVPIVSLKDRLSSLQSNISPDVKTPPQKDEDKIECTTTTTPTNSNVVNSNRCIVFEMNNHRVSTQQHFNSNVNHVDETMLPKVEIEQKIEPELKKSEYFKARNELKLVINEDPVSVDEVEPEDEVASNQPIDEHEISVLEALEIAFEAIDREDEFDDQGQIMMSHVSTASGVIDLNTSSSSAIDKLVREPIYEDIIDDIETNDNINNNSSNYSSDINTNLNNSKNNNNIISNNDHSNSVDKPNSGNDLINDEPYYQVPKSCEPYYEIPKPPKPVPLYENVDIFYHPTNSVLPVPRQSTPKEPPKEKPPPPPVDEYDDDDDDNDGDCDENDANHATSSPKNGNTNNSKQDEPFRRINSTRRIKNEIRTQRSSFLGLPNTNNGNHNYLELSVAPPPDMMTLLKEEKRIEKQLYMKAGIYDNSDSGVSENHSRQSSELFTSSEELDDINSIKKDERNTNMKNSSISNTDTSSNTSSNYMHPLQSIDDEIRMQCIEEKIREQEEVLRVERELLQLEQEELKRQRENLLLRENYTRRGLDYNNKVISTVNRRSMTDINDNGATNYMRIPQNNLYDVYQVQTDFRKSMPDLQNLYMNEMKKIPPSPPAKPMRAQQYQINHNTTHRGSGIFQNDPVDASQNINYHSRNNSAPEPTSPTVANDYDEVVMRNVHSGNMTKHTIHALSAVPKPKYTDVWVQQNQQHHHHHHQNRKSSYDQSSIYQNALTLNHNGSNNDFHNSSDMLHKKEKSKPASIIATGGVSNNNFSNNKNYNNKHWLIQEAEQRRIEQQQQKSGGGYNRHSMPGSIINYNNITNNNSSSWINNKPLSNNNGSNNGNSNNKPLPDSIIQTLTHIVQSRGIGERKNLSINQNSIPNLHHPDLYGGGRNNLIRHSNSSNNISSSSNYTVAKSQENIVSVSGKKKCSYCNEELGRGAAMVIESLRLFYHIDCFKCCVCGIKLGDGLNGTDVRVRNHKLHCHNCYSSDDGVKFSCV